LRQAQACTDQLPDYVKSLDFKQGRASEDTHEGPRRCARIGTVSGEKMAHVSNTLTSNTLTLRIGSQVEPAHPPLSPVMVPPAQTSANPDLLAPTIFHESWWLDAATQHNYSVAEAYSGGKVVGRLPYLLCKRKGLSHIIMPTLTHFLGPAVLEGEGSANTRFLRRLNITRELITQLPAAISYEIKCHAGVTDVIAFQAENFITTVQFTHEVHPLPEQELWKRMRDKTRNVIRRAQEQYDVVSLNDSQAFIEFYARNLQQKSYLDLSVCAQIIQGCLARGRGRILAARSATGALVAANFCAWDANSAYYLMSTRASNAGNGASSLLLWKAILDATGRNLVFDMDGLASEGGILFFAGFGAEVRPRYVAERFTVLGFIRRGYHAMRDPLLRLSPK
jgi:hypothetical protein